MTEEAIYQRIKSEYRKYGHDGSTIDPAKMAARKIWLTLNETRKEIDLGELSRKLDEALEKETPESIREWLDDLRNRNKENESE